MPILLKILSGPHLGADVELTDGEYRLGSDPSCDIVLQDAAMAASHAVLTLSGTTITVVPDAGAVLLNGQSITSAAPVSTLEVITLGGTHLALGPAADAWPAVPLPELFRLQQTERPAEHAPGASAAETPATPSDATELPADASRPLAENAPAPGMSISDLRTGAQQRARAAIEKLEHYDSASSWVWILQFAVGAGLLAAALLYVTGYVVSDSRLSQLELLMRGQNIPFEAVREGRMPSPRVLRARDEGSKVVIEGIVGSRETIELLRQLTAELGYPVELDVRVLADALKIVRKEIDRRHLALTVEPDSEMRIRVRGYVQDQKEADDLRAWLKKNMQGVADVRTNLVTWQLLEPILLEEGKRANLKDVAFVPAPREVVVIGRPRAMKSGEWQEAAVATQKRLRISLAFRPEKADPGAAKVGAFLNDWFRRQDAAEPDTVGAATADEIVASTAETKPAAPEQTPVAPAEPAAQPIAPTAPETARAPDETPQALVIAAIPATAPEAPATAPVAAVTPVEPVRQPPANAVADLQGVLEEIRESIAAASDTQPVHHDEITPVVTQAPVQTPPAEPVAKPAMEPVAPVVAVAPVTPVMPTEPTEQTEPAGNAEPAPELIAGGIMVSAVELEPAKRFRDQNGEWHHQGQILPSGFWVKDVFATGAILTNDQTLVILQIE